MRRSTRAGLAMLGFVVTGAAGQDLYDTTVLRTFHLTFDESNWQQILRNNYFSETLLGGTLEVDGEVYPDVGVRIRGNTSYQGLPPGSEKFSLKIKMDFVDPDQDLMGYDTLNLNNGFRDPTFCREVVYNNHVAQFIPNSRANHALVTINGENWGVYINVQQLDKRLLRDYFDDNDGLRIKCANNPNGPGLRFVGNNPSSYDGYEIQSDGGYSDPLGELIATCFAVTSGPLGSWQSSIDTIFAIDPSLWSVVLENIYSDDDSYVNKGCDFMTYQNPIDGRMHLLQRDANETFTETNWSVTEGFSSANRPVLSHVLDVPELRQRYMAHFRTAFEDCNWATFEPEFTTLRALIEAEVQADPKRIYSYQNFQDNFTDTVNIGGGFGGGNIIGIQEFFEEREDHLDNHTEMMTAGPMILSVAASDDAPDPEDEVWITAEVVGDASPVEEVTLYYRPDPTLPYSRVGMTDDGNAQDGAPGDGVYGALLPVAASGGQRVPYYIGATADNSYGSMTFLPARTEYAPLTIEYTFGAAGGMRITEWMYSGDSGEFVEFTNLSDGPIDMAGWSFDDSNAVAGEFDLSAFGIVQPGASVVLTESVAETFRTAWGLDGSIGIIGELGVTTGHNLGRNDQITLFDSGGNIVDRLAYGDEDFEGTIRTRDSSGQACNESLGQDDPSLWVLSELGDAFGSFESDVGELGTPGAYAAPSCDPCLADFNDDGILDIFDVLSFLDAFSSMDDAADFTDDGQFDIFDVLGYLGLFEEGCP